MIVGRYTYSTLFILGCGVGAARDLRFTLDHNRLTRNFLCPLIS